MSVDPKLLDVLVCPACKGRLVEVRSGQDGSGSSADAAGAWASGAAPAGAAAPLVGLDCRACRLRYSVVDDIPVMLVDQARRIPA